VCLEAQYTRNDFDGTCPALQDFRNVYADGKIGLRGVSGRPSTHNIDSMDLFDVYAEEGPVTWGVAGRPSTRHVGNRDPLSGNPVQ
jgi:hypothetical protein